MADVYEAAGDYGKAESLFKEALEISQTVYGPEHPDTAGDMNNLAELYRRTGDYAKAEPLYQEALKIQQKILGPDHPSTAISLSNLTLLELDLGNMQEAKRLAQLEYTAGESAFSQILSFGSEDQRFAYQRSCSLTRSSPRSIRPTC